MTDARPEEKEPEDAATDTEIASCLLEAKQGRFDLVHASRDVVLTDGVGKAEMAFP